VAPSGKESAEKIAEKYLDVDILRKIFAQLGYPALSEEDLDVLVQAADVDGDGRISITDFAEMVNFKYVL